MRKASSIAIALEQEILAGSFAVGEPINEMALAARFGVSRTPIREALVALASSGLVTLDRGKGATVAGISLEHVFEAYEVYAELVSLAASLAAQRMSDLERARMQSIHEEMASNRTAETREQYARLDAQLHGIIINASRNTLLRKQIEDCRNVIAGVRHASMASHENMDQPYAEHERLVRAILDGNAEDARTLMHAHVSIRGAQADALVAGWRRRFGDERARSA